MLSSLFLHNTSALSSLAIREYIFLNKLFHQTPDIKYFFIALFHPVGYSVGDHVLSILETQTSTFKNCLVT